jgi:hypothetical protein
MFNPYGFFMDFKRVQITDCHKELGTRKFSPGTWSKSVPRNSPREPGVNQYPKILPGNLE